MIFKMPCWFYDKQALFSTPSIQDGIDHKTECQYRKEGAQLIIQIGSQMELGCNTLATGVVYFHRFYMFHSFKTFSPYITACCCLFLAGKAEETPKKSKDIIKIAKKFLTEDKLLTLGENPREEVMTMEKILLQTMKFDLKVRHPYGYLLKYAKCLKGDKRKLHKMVQMAWTFINDSLHTTLSIQWEPEIIAIAMLYLAGKLVRFNVMGWSHRRPSQKYWWEIIVEDLSIEVVEDICHQVLDLYSPMGRYVVIEPPKAVIVKPQNSVNSHSSSCTVNTDIKTNVTHQSFSNSVNSDVTAPAIPLKDPRLESGSVFVKNEFHNTSNTPVLVTSSNLLPGTLSPATPTAPQSMVQQLQHSPQAFKKSNLSLATENHLHEESRFPSFNGSMFKKGFNNDSQSIDNRGFGFTNSINNNNNDYTDNRSMRHRGFGFMNNNNSDYRENRPFGRRGFRNYDGNNQSGRFRRPSFERNTNGDDHIENRPSGNRGFGNSNNYNGRYNENRPLGKRGFGRANNDDETKLPWTRGFGKSDNNNDTKPLWSRGFGNGNNNDEAKPLGTRGFGNADHYNNDCNDNDPRRRMRFNRGNRFQRSDTYPRRFNNNYERDRYSHNDGNRDASKDCVSDAPGKIVDKQRFYRPNNENVNNDNKEEESWD